MSAALALPTLSTARLILEPLTLAHSAGMFATFSREEVTRYSGPAADLNGAPIRLPAETPEDSDRIIVFFLKGAADGERFRWAVRTRDDGAFVGAIGFNHLGACPEIAYHLHPDAWGRGLMAEAAETALDWLRERPDAQEVAAYIERQNVASVRLAERLGMRPTGETSGPAHRYQMPLSR